MRHYKDCIPRRGGGSRVQLTNIIVLIHGFPLINQFSAEACLAFFSRGAKFKIRLPWNMEQ